MNNVIEIKNFSKTFNSFLAVNNVELSVRRGTVFGLLGPNGAGKTTIIKAMTGRLSFSEGEIFILNLDVCKDIKKIHQLIGVVAEAQNLYEHLSVWENIDFFRQLYNVDKSKTNEIIDALSLNEKSDAKVASLSKGLKQRVLLARSILHAPQLLFLDEPTSGIDPESALEVHNFINQMKELGTTIFLTSHDMEEVDSLCDEIAFINGGKIVATGSPKKLKKEFGKNEIEITYFDEEGKEICETFPMDDSDVFVKIGNIHKTKKVVSLHTKEASMKDVFLSLVKNGQGELK
ncbi:ABC transporter, ATP-binding protein [Bacteriovorax sp. BSW11_IV]|uniref:ABC transporter ATP-binding protein n=1 Tax=Bacteriovorax sp. BSW11_IV TaxID=1353529 RepID=UPI00038A3AF2|nr:ABC transporter ATP-binding protein [Bacteriovorax sp. BSW11_IV]EQC48912.1 ABC transporter, ATP-binding protein [Bacteriovorax sp. BSW11_IV]